MNQRKLTDLLPKGKENAILAKDLCMVLGINDTRKLRKMVEAARMNGELILSNMKTGGYYIPKNKEEIKEYYKTMSKYAESIKKSIYTAKKALKEE